MCSIRPTKSTQLLTYSLSVWTTATLTRFLFFTSFFAVSASNISEAATKVRLVNGTELEGELITASESSVQIAVDGKVQVLPVSAVVAIEFDQTRTNRDGKSKLRKVGLRPDSEILLRVLSKSTREGQPTAVTLENVGIVRLQGGDEIPVGSMFSGWITQAEETGVQVLDLDRALLLDEQLELDHPPVVSIDPAEDESVVFQRPPNEAETGGSDDDVLVVGSVVTLRFAGEE